MRIKKTALINKLAPKLITNISIQQRVRVEFSYNTAIKLWYISYSDIPKPITHEVWSYILL